MIRRSLWHPDCYVTVTWMGRGLVHKALDYIIQVHDGDFHVYFRANLLFNKGGFFLSLSAFGKKRISQHDIIFVLKDNEDINNCSEKILEKCCMAVASVQTRQEKSSFFSFIFFLHSFTLEFKHTEGATRLLRRRHHQIKFRAVKEREGQETAKSQWGRRKSFSTLMVWDYRRNNSDEL